ncbi:MAG: LptF/LptG family permease [Caulobacteraceae bacterium]|nr:LptF/LptG family permease [Caulobacteraceae bacterium]
MRVAPGSLDRYVLTESLAGLAQAMGIISSMVLMISFVDLSRQYGGRADVGFLRLVELVLLQAPSVILLLLPFVFLFGGLSTFVALNRRSELTAMRAAGVSAWRFILPAAGMAVFIGIVDVTALNPLAAGLNGHFEDAKTAINQGFNRSGSPIWLRQGDEHTQIVIHADRHDMVGGIVRLQHVSLYLQNVTPQGGLQFSRRIDAAEALLGPGYWRLNEVRETTPGAGSVRSEVLSIPSSLDRRTAMEKFAARDSVSFWRLPHTIRRADAAGFSSAPYRLRFFQLLATPLLFAGMTVLAAAFSLRLTRLGGVAGLAAAGVTLGFVIFFFDRLCGALGAAEVVPPLVGAWAPPAAAMLAGCTLLCYTEDG